MGRREKLLSKVKEAIADFDAHQSRPSQQGANYVSQAPPVATSSKPPPSYPQPTPFTPFVQHQAVTQATPWPLPEFDLRIDNLGHDGAKAFLRDVNAGEELQWCHQSALALLYESPANHTTTAPQKRKVTLILRSMDGVAYTTNGDGQDSSEIHFSLEHIRGTPSNRQRDEIRGVLLHEMVHVVQYNGLGSANGGLIEGIADWVRLQCNLGPPHWRRAKANRWDEGYDKTAFFLQYLEDRFGKGTIRALNEKLRINTYEEKAFWTELVGRPVEQLWADYLGVLDAEEQQQQAQHPEM